MSTKDKMNLSDRQAIRDISIKYMADMLGKTQAISMIEAIKARNVATSELAIKTIEEITRL